MAGVGIKRRIQVVDAKTFPTIKRPLLALDCVNKDIDCYGWCSVPSLSNICFVIRVIEIYLEQKPTKKTSPVFVHCGWSVQAINCPEAAQGQEQDKHGFHFITGFSTLQEGYVGVPNFIIRKSSLPLY